MPIVLLLILFALTSFSSDIEAFRSIKENCATDWKKAVFLYQNYNGGKFVSFQKTKKKFNIFLFFKCFDHTWYISVDFQLFILSPALVLFLKKTRRLGVTVLVLLIFLLQFLCYHKLSSE